MVIGHKEISVFKVLLDPQVFLNCRGFNQEQSCRREPRGISSCELSSELLKGGYIGGYIGPIKVTKGDTRSLDYSSFGSIKGPKPQIPNIFYVDMCMAT